METQAMSKSSVVNLEEKRREQGKHARDRFRERYGSELGEAKYEGFNAACRAGECEVLGEQEDDGGKLIVRVFDLDDLFWANAIFDQRSQNISTFLPPGAIAVRGLRVKSWE